MKLHVSASLTLVTLITVLGPPSVADSAGSSVSPPAASRGHAVLGTWSYSHQGKTYQREFTRSGQCILRLAGGKVAWTYPYKIVDSKTAFVFSTRHNKWLRHTVLRDGRLNIENSYLATRVKGPQTSAGAAYSTSSPSRLRIAGQDPISGSCSSCIATCGPVDWLSGRSLPTYELELGGGMTASQCVDQAVGACQQGVASYLNQASCKF